MTMINPAQAIEEYIGEQFSEWLGLVITQEMNSWPFMAQINQIHPTPAKLKKFMLQRFLAAEAWFGRKSGDPGFLRFAIANLSESDDPLAESSLEILEKRRQEELAGHKLEDSVVQTLSRQYWMRLLQALGLTLDEIERAKAKEMTRNYVADLSDIYSNSDWQTALGAMFAQELSEVEEFRNFVPVLKQNTDLSEKDIEIFTQTQFPVTKFSPHLIDKLIIDPESKALVWEGVKKQLDIRRDFLTALGKYLVV